MIYYICQRETRVGAALMQKEQLVLEKIRLTPFCSSWVWSKRMQEARKIKHSRRWYIMVDQTNQAAAMAAIKWEMPSRNS